MEPSRTHGHRRAVAAATLAAGALIAQQVAGKATRDALFLSTFRVSSLPVMMIASALVSALAVLAFSAALSRRSPARVVPVALAAGTVLLLGEWGLSLVQPRLAAVIVYLHMAVFGATLVSGFWSLVNERFDPYTARRAMGQMGLGASLGGVTGGLLAWSAAGHVPVAAMLAIMAALNVACLLALSGLRAGVPPTGAPAAAPEAAGPLSGLRLLREVPYLQDLALVVALGAATEALLDYVLNARAVATFGRGQPLMSFFALFHTGMGLLALAVQITLSRAALQGLGLAGTVALRPAMVAMASLLGVVDPRLWSAIVGRGVHGVLQNSLFRSGYELLFTPLPERLKRPSKTIVDVGFDKVGSVGGALATLAVVSFIGGDSARVLFAIAAAGGLTALAVSQRLHRGYVAALEESLRSGVVRLDVGDVIDSTTMGTMTRTGFVGDRQAVLREIAALRAQQATGDGAGAVMDVVAQAVTDLRSGDPEAIRRGLRAASDTMEPALVGHLIPLLAENAVFLDVLRVLRRALPRATGQLLDVLLDPGQDVVVRRRIPRVLRGSPTQRAADGLRQALADPRFEVRRQCALTLARITEREPALDVPRASVFAATIRELEAGPWGEEGGTGVDDSSSDAARPRTPFERGLAHVFTLLSLAVEREPLRIAYWALLADDRALRGTALEYLENVLPDDVRHALWPHLGVRAAAHPARPRQEVVRDLMRLGDTSAISRDAIKRVTPRR
jgi:ATP/ADP translocase